MKKLISLLLIAFSFSSNAQMKDEFIRMMQRYEGKFDVVAYGANPNDDNDDSAGWQAAINAQVAAGYGVVWIPTPKNTSGYHYYLDNALVTSVNSINPNCQLYIPLVKATDTFPNGRSKFVSVVFKGESVPNLFSEGIAGVARNQNGCIVESRINGSGTLPAVFGSSYYTDGLLGDRNYCKVVLENIIIRTRTKTLAGADTVGTMSAVNFTNVAAMGGRNFKIDISSKLADSDEPTTTWGLITPRVNNKAELQFEGDIHVEGYWKGIQINEHFNAFRVACYGNVNGIVIVDGFHNYTIQQYLCEVNQVNILFAGTHHGTIVSYETEHKNSGSEWYVFSKDFSYSSGQSELTIVRANIVVSGVGRDSTDLVADVDVNYIIMTGHGHNFEGGSGTPSEDIVILDEFNDVNGTDLQDHDIDEINVPLTAWDQVIGLNEIQGNTCAVGSSEDLAFLDPGITDCIISMKILRQGDANFGIVFRYEDSNDFWIALFEHTSGVGTLYIFEVIAGTYTERGTNQTIVTTTGVEYNMRVELSGDNITATMLGEDVTYSSSTGGTRTKCGIRTGIPTGGNYLRTYKVINLWILLLIPVSFFRRKEQKQAA